MTNIWHHWRNKFVHMLLRRGTEDHAEEIWYNGFISYNRTADSEIAAALQSALHRFAKPWNKLRALRIFRDDTTLPASLALWSTIQDALKRAEFLILVASPSAAESEWVNREVEFWCENKPQGQILIALVGGDIICDNTSTKLD